jgi:tetratricopeptide (TPR) repeat protein
MLIKELFQKVNLAKVFSVSNDGDEDPLNWIVEPTKLEIIPDEEGHFIVLAKEVNINDTSDCFMNIVTPERIAEIVIKNKDGKVSIENLDDQEASIIPVVASDCFGIYEMYYSKENPQVGIDILKSGLLKSNTKTAIAEDLGYIFRDENRIKEAIEAFLISEQTDPSSEYIYHELAHLYSELEEKEKQIEYEQKFKATN